MKVHVAVSAVVSDLVEGEALVVDIDPEGHLVVMDGPNTIAVYNRWDYWRDISE